MPRGSYLPDGGPWATSTSIRMTWQLEAGRKLLADFFVPGFKILFHLRHELVGECAVDQAVVVAQREMNDAANRDGVVSVFVGNDERHFRYATDAHDGGIGLVDDGQSEDGAKLARVGDGEGGSIDIFGLELLSASAFAEISDAALQAQEVEIARILDDGDDESPVECDGDADRSEE